jgi:TolB-like protein/Tfp pilus assembly protein PilF
LAALGGFDLKGIEGQTQLYQVLLPWQTPASRLAGIKLPPTRMLWLAGGIVVVAVLALLSVSMKPQPDSVAAADTRVIPEKSIVVLPFKNLSADAANGYFADGMQDEILTLLAQLGDLRVISRSSTERYSSEPADLKTVSTQLGVAHVLEGSVQKVGDQVLINVQLIDARTDTHVWAESYRRTVTDVFTVESEVAQQVADNLKLKLDPVEVQRLNSQPTTSTAAHDLYLRAYALLNSGDAKGLEQALQLARQAVAIDPHYAAAWMIISGADVALADAYRAPREVIGEARSAALKAIDADDRLSAAHAIYGSVEFNYDWDFPLAELELKKALALDPNDDYSLFWYASYLAGHAGDFAQAHAMLKRARVINPLSAWHPAWESMFAIWQGDLPEAMALAKQALKIDPDFYYEGDVLARVYAAEGNYKACVQRYQELIPTRPQAAESFEYAICAIHVGDTARGRAILAILENEARDRYVDGTHLAAIYTALGDKERAFAALERAYQDRSAHLVYLAWNPLLKPLQTDPRFVLLVAKIGKSRFPE